MAKHMDTMKNEPLTLGSHAETIKITPNASKDINPLAMLSKTERERGGGGVLGF